MRAPFCAGKPENPAVGGRKGGVQNSILLPLSEMSHMHRGTGVKMPDTSQVLLLVGLSSQTPTPKRGALPAQG